MAFGKLDNGEFDAPMAEINTTPLVDVMLVLMVIFLVTAPMLTQAVSLELPNERASTIADDNPVSLSITSDGQFYWGKEEVSEAELGQRMAAIAAEDPSRPLHLRADVTVAYGKVSTVLALAQRHNLRNVGFVTEPR